jgi:glycosyltransferase involved in cell wall biosynthesis
MPLTDDEITRGKCGFKAIQYMALGMPVPVSPIGVNNIIVDENINGFNCHTEQDWEEKIIRLLKDCQLRASKGRMARKKIEDHYSVKVTAEAFTRLFK